MELPQTLNERYQLTAHIARGGMADVYEGQDHLLGRKVAIKMLHPQHSTDEAFVKRFRREAQAAANLSHPSIVSIYDWGQFDTTYFIVMELVHGRTLRNVLRSEGALLPRRALEITSEVAAALSVAHRAGIVHRDIKPGNILLATDGSVKVTDFGIARAWGDSMDLTRTGAVIGTATYFSPEQAQGAPADHRSDIYSLGVVMFEMLTGEPPFRGETPVSVALQHISAQAGRPSNFNPDVLVEIDGMVERMMHKDPGQRYQTADEIRSVIQRFLAGKPLADPSTSPPRSVEDAQSNGGTTIGPAPPAHRPAPPAPVAYQPVEEPASSNLPAVVGAFSVLAILAVLVVLMFRFLGGDTTRVNQAVLIPDLSNTLEVTAFERLGDLGLSPIPARQASDTITEGRVITTDPGAGTEVDQGVAVTVYVSAGREEIAVPLLVGQSEAAAVSLLSAQGLAVGTISTQTDSPSPAGTVVTQDPVAGVLVPDGSIVNLVIAQGPAFVVLEDLVGMTEREANIILRDLGLSWEIVEEFSEEILEGLVIETSPTAGSELIPGQVVTVTISIGLSPVLVPDLVGLSHEEAFRALSELELEMRTLGEAEAVDDPALDGIVSSQSPLPETPIDRGTVVTISLGFWVGDDSETSTTSTTIDLPAETTPDTDSVDTSSSTTTSLTSDTTAPVEPPADDDNTDTGPDTDPGTTLPENTDDQG